MRSNTSSSRLLAKMEYEHTRLWCALPNRLGCYCITLSSGPWAWFVLLDLWNERIANGLQHLYHNSKYWLNFKAMWTDYPVRQLDGVFKWYYLVQTAFWLQQIFVINIEERRKDHIQMYTHHIVTSLLLMGSYGFHCSQVGNVILCLMDVVDILLPVSPICNPVPIFRTFADMKSKGRQNVEIPRLSNRLRHYVRIVHGCLVHWTSRFLHDGLLVHSLRYSKRCPLRKIPPRGD